MKKKWKLSKEYWPFLKKSTRITKIAEHTDNLGKATKINQFFATVGDNLAKNIPERANPVNIAKRPLVFELHQLQLTDIATIIRDMNPSASCGTDGLTSRILKTAGPSIFPVVLYPVNLSISKSPFPSNWNTGCVTALYKEGDSKVS